MWQRRCILAVILYSLCADIRQVRASETDCLTCAAEFASYYTQGSSSSALDAVIFDCCSACARDPEVLRLLSTALSNYDRIACTWGWVTALVTEDAPPPVTRLEGSHGALVPD